MTVHRIRAASGTPIRKRGEGRAETITKKRHGSAAGWAFASGALAADLTPISRIQPEFPREAISAGTEKGHVRARMTVDAAGEVSRVEILEAEPRRLFERVVVKTLSQWRFAPGAAERSMEIDIDFRR